jgi:hypothetical protein
MAARIASPNLVDESLNIQIPTEYAGVQFWRRNNVPTGLVIGNSRPWSFAATPYVNYYPSGQRSSWCHIEAVQGVFNWPGFDQALAFLSAVPRLYHTLGNPPTWATAVQVGTPVDSSSWPPRSNQPPDNIADWSNFCTRIAQRAKDAGRTGIYWDLWNEVEVPGAWSQPGVWGPLGPLAKAANQAIKAVDSTAKILSPCMVSTYDTKPTDFVTLLNVSDGAGGILANWIDGINNHSYAKSLYPTGWYRSTLLWTDTRRLKAALAAGGFGALPIHINEAGVEDFLAYNQADQKKLLFRSMLINAAAGMQGYCAYTYDDPLVGNIAAFESEWNALAGLMNGGLLSRLVIHHDQSVSATISGQTVTY